MNYDKVVGIGYSCATKAHIKETLCQPSETYFFDWLISYHKETIRALTTDFRNILKPENLSVDSRKIRVVDAENGLLYQHDFPSQNGIILDDFASHADKIREKYERRSKRTLDLLRSDANILIVRYTGMVRDAITAEARQEFSGLMKSKFGKPNIIYITMLDAETRTTDDGWIYRVPQDSHWKGESGPWREAFRYAGALS